ncbi:MAG: ABC transporter ATP-binding protein [Solirubrobacterales bacterium]
MLEVRGVHKSYGATRALADVDLDVASGEVVALLGPNGAGKTTLVSIVAGLRKPDQGRVCVNGIDVIERPQAARRELGFAPQEIGIYPTVSVRDNLHFFGELAGLRGQSLRQRIAEVAEAFSLAELLDRRGQSLSGGEARRLHAAMIVLHSPALLLLDEATAGVDIQTRNRILELVKSLAEDGTAVVYSTHYLNEVEQLDAAAVAILTGGRIVASGSIPDLISALGGASVELRFRGRPPELDLPEGTVPIGSDGVRVPSSGSPTLTAASLLKRLDGAGAELREIKLIQPNLESVFLAITSRPPGEGEEAS